MTGQWQGKTRGSLLGHRIFVFFLRRFGLGVSYFFLRPVALYFLVFASSTRVIHRYFREAHGYGFWKALRSTYLNYYVFGQTLLDKVAFLSGVEKGFTVSHEGGEVLDQVSAMGKGGILVSGHIGNWEIAGQLLNRLKTGFNILMYENDHARLSQYMQEVMKEKKFRVIAIRDEDMSHLVELHKAFSNNELVVMHGDRYREGNKTLEAVFFGRKARFPAGPFLMAASFGVPLVIVFAVKESTKKYHFFALPPVKTKRTRPGKEREDAMQELLKRYVSALENVVRQYPLQWFNYYDFWK